MSGGKISLVAASFALLILLNRGSSQDLKPGPVRLMFYNVENLFDLSDDSLTNDKDFLPGGVMKWTYSRYRTKINAIYKTIVSAGSYDPPQIVAMCEVENRRVLDDLVYGTYLSKFGYRIIHEESPDQRGIDVCLIYRGDNLKLINYKYWIPARIGMDNFRTRSVLYAVFAISEDTLHLIVNHWPSRRGGVLAGEELRNLISEMIDYKTDSILGKNSPGSKVIITGDFNCTPDDNAIKKLLSCGGSEEKLTNLSEKPAEKGYGTYRYQGTWEMLDQVIISPQLLTCSKGLYSGQEKLIIFSPDFLLKKDPRFPGYSPFSTYKGYRYQGGFSDHLPILLDLGVR